LSFNRKTEKFLPFYNVFVFSEGGGGQLSGGLSLVMGLYHGIASYASLAFLCHRTSWAAALSPSQPGDIFGVGEK